MYAYILTTAIHSFSNCDLNARKCVNHWSIAADKSPSHGQVNNDNMLIVQYPMQFSGPPIEILATRVQANGGSINTVRVHAFYALLLPSKHYKIMHRVSYLLHEEDRAIHNFTLTGN